MENTYERLIRSCRSVADASCHPASIAAQTVVPVQFAHGTSSSTVTGAIKGDAYTDYRISVRAGRRLAVSLARVAGSPYFNVIEPGAGDVAIHNSSMGQQTFTGTTAKSGAYVIRVYQMRETARRGELARFSLTVGVSGGGGANAYPTVPAHRPGDALVQGTPYHATALVKCRTMAGGAMGDCKAGVIYEIPDALIEGG